MGRRLQGAGEALSDARLRRVQSHLPVDGGELWLPRGQHSPAGGRQLLSQRYVILKFFCQF